MNTDKLDKLAMAMIKYDSDAERIQHFLKVHALCHLIGVGEGLTERELYTLEAAAYVHDIGIKAAYEKYGHQNGKLQEELGPAIAEEMLQQLGFERDVTDRVMFLVGHHHTYANVDGADYRILLEADWLVNNLEYMLEGRDIYASYDVIFKTKTGKQIFSDMFPNSLIKVDIPNNVTTSRYKSDVIEAMDEAVRISSAPQTKRYKSLTEAMADSN